MLTPSCTHCGCALDATPTPPDVTPLRPPVAVPRAVRLALRALGVVCCALVLVTGARLGYRLAGASGALIAFGAAGFLLLPFIPERLGAPGRSRR